MNASVCLNALGCTVGLSYGYIVDMISGLESQWHTPGYWGGGGGRKVSVCLTGSMQW